MLISRALRAAGHRRHMARRIKVVDDQGIVVGAKIGGNACHLADVDPPAANRSPHHLKLAPAGACQPQQRGVRVGAAQHNRANRKPEPGGAGQRKAAGGWPHHPAACQAARPPGHGPYRGRGLWRRSCHAAGFPLLPAVPPTACGPSGRCDSPPAVWLLEGPCHHRAQHVKQSHRADLLFVRRPCISCIYCMYGIQYIDFTPCIARGARRRAGTGSRIFTKKQPPSARTAPRAGCYTIHKGTVLLLAPETSIYIRRGKLMAKPHCFEHHFLPRQRRD